MIIDTKFTEGKLVLAPKDRLDSSTAGEFEETVKKSINENVVELVIDLKDVDFISSKGLRVLVTAYRMMNGKPIVLENANNSIVEVIKLSGLLKIFSLNN